jgi:hypothetical protein
MDVKLWLSLGHDPSGKPRYSVGLFWTLYQLAVLCSYVDIIWTVVCVCHTLQQKLRGLGVMLGQWTASQPCCVGSLCQKCHVSSLYEKCCVCILHEKCCVGRLYEKCHVSRLDMIYLLTAIRLTPGGNSTVHIYTQTVHRTTQWHRITRTEET